MCRKRFVRALLAAIVVPLASACEDPMVILGDWPGSMRVVAGVSDGPGAFVDSLGIDTRLSDPRGLTVSTDGNLYIADRGNQRIVSVTSAGSARLVFSPSLCGSGGGREDCPVEPLGLGLDTEERLLVADGGAHRIWRLFPASRFQQLVAGTGEKGSSPDGTPAVDAAIDTPDGIVMGRDGTIYFSERLGHRVRRILANGTLETVAGTGLRDFGGDGGPAADAHLDSPSGLALHGDTLYIADRGNNRVRLVDLGSGVIETFVGNGTPTYAGDGGPAERASLNRPEGLALTPDGRRLYIADSENHRVREVDVAAGFISAFAGTGDEQYTENLVGAGATGLARPTGLTMAPQGMLFIAASGNHLVWRTPIQLY